MWLIQRPSLARANRNFDYDQLCWQERIVDLYLSEIILGFASVKA
jgi:hypothetical protein